MKMKAQATYLWVALLLGFGWLGLGLGRAENMSMTKHKPISLRVARRVSHAGDEVSLEWRAPACGNGHLTYEFRVELVRDGKTAVQAVEHLNKKTKQMEPTTFKCNQRASHTLTGLTAFAAYNASVVETTSGEYVASKAISFTPLVTPVGTPRNDGGGVLTAVTTGAAVAKTDASFDAVVFDLEGDGDDDILVVNNGEKNELLRNDNGTLTAVTTGAAVERSDASYGVVAFDLEGDGDDDILVLNYGQKNELLRNDNGGSLLRTGDAVARSDISTGAVVFDLDGDGDDDILVLNAGQKNELLRNDNGMLTAVTTGDAVARADASMGAVVFDLEGDGDDDILVLNWGEPNELCRNDKGTLNCKLILAPFQYGTTAATTTTSPAYLQVIFSSTITLSATGQSSVTYPRVAVGTFSLMSADSDPSWTSGAMVLDTPSPTSGSSSMISTWSGVNAGSAYSDGGFSVVAQSCAVSGGSVSVILRVTKSGDFRVCNYMTYSKAGSGFTVLNSLTALSRDFTRPTGDCPATPQDAFASGIAWIPNSPGSLDFDNTTWRCDANCQPLDCEEYGTTTATTSLASLQTVTFPRVAVGQFTLVSSSDTLWTEGTYVQDVPSPTSSSISTVSDERGVWGGSPYVTGVYDIVAQSCVVSDGGSVSTILRAEKSGSDGFRSCFYQTYSKDTNGNTNMISSLDVWSYSSSFQYPMGDCPATFEAAKQNGIWWMNPNPDFNNVTWRCDENCQPLDCEESAVTRSNGAVVFDLEGDGDDDIFVLNFGEKNELLRNDNGTFTFVKTGDALARTDDSTGAVVFDLEGDGDDDILVLNFGEKNELIRNDGGGVLTAVTTGDSVARANNSTGAVVFDLEGDGDDDILVLNWGQTNELLRNDNGTMTAVTTGDAVARADCSTSAVVIDLDGDGNDDILVVNGFGPEDNNEECQKNELLRNNNGTLTAVTTGDSVTRADNSKGAVAFDLAGNGKNDILVLNVGQKNELLHNYGGSLLSTGDAVKRADESHGAVVFDLEGDGDDDILVLNWGQKNELLRNYGGALMAVTTGDAVARTDRSRGALAFDLDGDGDDDILVLNDGQKNELLRNDGGGVLTAVTTGDAVASTDESSGAVVFDLEGDGDEDILVLNFGQKNELLRNDNGMLMVVTTGDSVARTDNSQGAVVFDLEGDGDDDILVLNSLGQKNELLRNDGGGVLTAVTTGDAVERTDNSNGAVVFDLKDDGADDILVVYWGEKNELLRNEGRGMLMAVTMDDAVARSDISFGAVVFDLDGDGDDDILVLNAGPWGQKNELLRNYGGALMAVTTGDAVARTDRSRGALAFDLDGDGDDDILVLNDGQKNELLRNDGGGVLTAVTTGDAVASTDESSGAVVFDLEGDGDDDILVLNSGQKNELLRNDGGGVLTAVTTGDAVNRTDSSYGAVAFDLEGDGDDDILVLNSLGQKNELLRNDGGGVLTAVTTGDAVAKTDESFDAVVFDLEGDGDDDILVVNWGEKNELLRNDGGGVLTAVTTGDAVARTDRSRGAVVFDLEGDGDDDILVVNAGQKNELLRNDGGGVLTRVEDGAAVERSDSSYGAVAFDLEGDGDYDILVLNYGQKNELLSNCGSYMTSTPTGSGCVPSMRPTISSVTPASAYTTGSTVHLVNGKGFIDLTSLNITIGSVACTPSERVRDSVALCTSAPAGTGASRPIVVTSYGVVSDPVNFSYLPPAITSIEPSFIDASTNSPTTTFTITGTNFGGDRSKRRLKLGSFDCVEPDNTDLVSHMDFTCNISDPAFAAARDVFPAVITVDGQNSSDASRVCYVANASSTTCLCEPGEAYDRVDNECVPCPPGQYNRDGLLCKPCPEHAICPGGSLLLPAAGWWRENNASTEFWRCARGECLADNATNPSPSGVVCRERHTGVLCGECVEGCARQGGPGCEQCAATDSGGGALIVVGLLVGILFLALVLIWATWRHRFRHVEKQLSLTINRMSSRTSSDDAETDEKADAIARSMTMSSIDDAADRSKTTWVRAGLFLKVAITFYQCLSSYEGTFDVPWPDAFRSFMGVFSTLSVQLLTMPGVGCVFRGVSSLEGLLFTVLWPLIPIGFVAGSWYIGTRGGIAGDDDRRAFSARCSDLLLRILFLIYPMQAAATLGTFSCVPAAGREYLASDVTVVCWRGGEHAQMIVLSVFGIALYVVGIPAYFAWTLWRLDVPRLAREMREDAALLVAVEKFCAPIDDGDEKVAELRACTASDVRQVLTESGLVPAVLRHAKTIAVKGDQTAKHWAKDGGDDLAELARVSVAVFEVGEVPWSKRNSAAADAKGRAVAQGGFIFASYHCSAWFFELVDLARKLVLTGLLVFVDPGGISQLVVGLLVCLSMLLYSQHLGPFVDNTVDQANFHSNVQLFVVLFAGLLLQNNAETQGDADEALYTATLVFLSSSVAALPFLEAGRVYFEMHMGSGEDADTVETMEGSSAEDIAFPDYEAC